MTSLSDEEFDTLRVFVREKYGAFSHPTAPPDIIDLLVRYFETPSPAEVRRLTQKCAELEADVSELTEENIQLKRKIDRALDLLASEMKR